MSKDPFVHVETRDGMFVGAISDKIGVPSKEKSWRREVAKFCGSAIADGNTITTLYSREEYAAFIKDMPVWKPPKKEKQGELL